MILFEKKFDQRDESFDNRTFVESVQAKSSSKKPAFDQRT